MAYPPAKRLRSNTSDTVANSTPQTAAPALRQSADPNANLALYTAGGYSGGYADQHPARIPLPYGAYPSSQETSPSTGYENGYSPTTYSPGYGAPGHQASSYGLSYTHSPNNGPGSDHSASFAQNVLTTAPHATYSQASGSNGLYTTLPTHTQANGFGASPDTSTTSPRQLIPEYGGSYTTEPPAHTSFHSVAPPYPGSAIHPTYNSPPQAPVFHQNGHQVSPDTPEEDEDEDAQGEPADDPPQMYSEPTPVSAPVNVHVPTPAPTPNTKRDKNPDPEPTSASPQLNIDPSLQPGHRCACKKGRGKKKACTMCACSKYGKVCGVHCTCGDACGNPFAHLEAFFGPSASFPKPCEANACFATWLSNQPNIEELDLDLMVDMLLSDDESWASIKAWTPGFQKWEDRWKRTKEIKRGAKKAAEERQKLEFELIRGALGNCNPDDFCGFWYSFCAGQWVPMDDWEHCRECKKCVPSSEWHCDKCNRCTKDQRCCCTDGSVEGVALQYSLEAGS